MRKICVITSNRSDYSRLRSVLNEINARKDLELVLIAIASHLLPDYGDTINSIKKDGFKVQAIARTIIEGEDVVAMAKSVGIGCLELPTLLDLHKPDFVLIVGDRFDILPAALASAIMNIPLAHIQGGEVTGSIDESVRHAITKFAHIHFASNEDSTQRIIKMGETPSRVFNTGCPAMDIFKKFASHPREKLSEISRRNKLEIDFSKPYLLVIQHPVTSEYEQAGSQISETLDAVAETGIPAIIIYPNVDAGSTHMIASIRQRGCENKALFPNFAFLKHVDFEDYISLLKHAACIVGNSSSGIRESSFFGVPAVNIGTRQKGRLRGKNVTDVSHNKREIRTAILNACSHGKFEPEFIYGNGKSGKKIAEILATITITTTQKRIEY